MPSLTTFPFAGTLPSGMRVRIVRLAALALLVGTQLAGAALAADAPAPSASAVEFAASEHQRGYQAYMDKKFEEAALHFENAFFSVPNAGELRGAIRARRDAKQYARAATLAALGHRKFPDDVAMKKAADQAIAEAKSHVQEITVACATECGVVADGKVVTIERANEVRFFLDPGHHEVVVTWSEDRTKTLQLDAKAGASYTMKVQAPP